MYFRVLSLQYKIEASFIEIYNETLQDLLSTAKKDVVKHEVRIDSKNQGKVYVTNITPVVISSEQQVCVFQVHVYYSMFCSLHVNAVSLVLH